MLYLVMYLVLSNMLYPTRHPQMGHLHHLHHATNICVKLYMYFSAYTY